MKPFQRAYNSSSNSQSQRPEHNRPKFPPIYSYRRSVLQRAESIANSSLPTLVVEAPLPLQNVYLDPLVSPKAMPVESTAAAKSGDKPAPKAYYRVETTEKAIIVPVPDTVANQDGIDRVQAAQEALDQARPSIEINDVVKGLVDVR